MRKENERHEAPEYPGGVPPEWRVLVHRARREDGSEFVYYDFAPSPAARESELEPAVTRRERRH